MQPLFFTFKWPIFIGTSLTPIVTPQTGGGWSAWCTGFLADMSATRFLCYLSHRLTASLLELFLYSENVPPHRVFTSFAEHLTGFKITDAIELEDDKPPISPDLSSSPSSSTSSMNDHVFWLYLTRLNFELPKCRIEASRGPVGRTSSQNVRWAIFSGNQALGWILILRAYKVHSTFRSTLDFLGGDD